MDESYFDSLIRFIFSKFRGKNNRSKVTEALFSVRNSLTDAEIDSMWTLVATQMLNENQKVSGILALCRSHM